MNKNLMNWSIDRDSTNAHRRNVINHIKFSMKLDGGLEYVLPPLFFKDIEECTDEEIRLLDNFTYLFFKGEECGSRIF